MEHILNLNYHKIIHNLNLVNKQGVQNLMNVRFHVPEIPFEGR